MAQTVARVEGEAVDEYLASDEFERQLATALVPGPADEPRDARAIAQRIREGRG